MKVIENEPDAWKEKIGKSLRGLGFEKVFYQKQEKLSSHECCVFYTDVDIELYSTDSYVLTATIIIQYYETYDVDMFTRIIDIVSNVEKEFCTSNLSDATTFMFGKSQITELGTSYMVRIPFTLRREVDHG
ncbi:MAG: hypothetical protein D4S01_10255 [Dehalococcoidia bacterium]|nr:MAG: hypothetical protein D4S01_10255 [Dehalococcoidia bacterium]